MLRYRFIARTLRGLEKIAAKEIEALLAPARLELGHREVRFELPRLDRRLGALGTVDDVFLVLAERDLPAGAAALGVLEAAAASLDLDAAAGELRALRPVGGAGTFALTVSLLRRRRPRRGEVEEALAARIAAASGRRRARHDDAGLAVRVHLDDRRATLAVRIGDEPLHRRGAGVARAGALHPPLAGAMARLLDPRPGEVVLDPATGTGTLLAEALRLEPRLRALGFDVDPAAIAIARARLPAAFLRVGDAGRLALPDGSVAGILVNPPWGRAVAARGSLRQRRGRLWRELARVLGADGRGVALLPAEGPEPDRLGPLAVRSSTWVRVAGAEAWIVSFGR